MRFKRITTIVLHASTAIFTGLIVAGILGSPDAQALERDKYQQQRVLFTEVENALKRGDHRPFKRHSRELEAYPLHPYLVYRDLRNRLSRARDGEVEIFLKQYGDDLPLADKLRHRWLKQLAQRGYWGRFLRHYKESIVVVDKENRCSRAQALIRTGQLQRARTAMRTLWLVDFSQPKQCDPVFEYGFERGVITDDLVWRRALLVWDRGREGLMNYLGSKLRGDPRRWFDSLKQARRDPRKVALAMRERLSDSAYASDVLVFAIRRLIKQDVVAAEQTWQKIKSNCTACQSLRKLEKDLGITAAKRLLPKEAYRLLSGLPRRYHDQESRYWRIRAALRAGMWQQVPAAIDELREEESDFPQWNYWRAHALSLSGRRKEAHSIWERLAQDDDYYGYLSADRLNQAYPYALSSIGSAAGSMAGLAAYPAVLRIHELLILKRSVDASRELLMLVERLDASEKLKFAVLADRWRWPIGAIRSLAGNDANKHFVERFPLPYRDIVSAESRRSKIPAEWIYGIMRRESAFVADIRSSAGALGLMQLLPGTARQVAPRLGMKKPSTYGILSPKTNIRLGTAYIKSLYQRSDNNLAVSLAGYNAGPRNARRWLDTAPVSDSAVWIDTIPFDETRLYVRSVLFYTLIYRHRLGKPPVRLRQLMETNELRLD